MRSVEHRLITKIITRMDRKLREIPSSLINLSLKIGYRNTTLSNHDIIRPVRFV
jgi:hypothetical protein